VSVCVVVPLRFLQFVNNVTQGIQRYKSQATIAIILRPFNPDNPGELVPEIIGQSTH